MEQEYVNLQYLIQIIRKRLIIFILIPLITTLICGVINYNYLPAIYRASTSLMVVNRQLVSTCSEIAKSHSVAGKGLELSNVNLSYEEFYPMIDVQMVIGTEIIQISVEDTSPARAKLLANTTAKAFIQKTKDIMKVSNVKIVDMANEPTIPIKPRKNQNMQLAFLLGTMSSIFLVFLLEYLDNTLKTKEDVERYLDLPVIGSIPKID